MSRVTPNPCTFGQAVPTANLVINPPRRLRRSKLIRDFLEDGQIQLQRLVKYANLNSKSNILDIGCGGGKLISALLPVIKEGTYSTFEVNKEYIEFLSNSIAKKYHNFTFNHADLWHSYYNLKYHIICLKSKEY